MNKTKGIEVIIGDSRNMDRIKDGAVHLVVTSPPYPMIEMWDTLFNGMDYCEMHKHLAEVWSECYRALINGGIMCVNIGDATRKINGEFRLFCNHSKVVEHCERIGFTTLPYILWKKPTNKPNAFLGSGFIPPNAYVTLDCEFILIFRKGNIRKFKPKDKIRYGSAFTKAERDKWFTQVWNVQGVKQNGFASFPLKIPYRLIRMFSIIGETVLDPFVGSGTTLKACDQLQRHGIGYEIKKEYKKVIYKKVGG